MRKTVKDPNDTKIALLKHVDSPYDLGIIKALLDEHKIPYMIKEEGSDQYLRIFAGRSLTGADIMIPEPLLVKAAALLESIGMMAYHSETES